MQRVFSFGIVKYFTYPRTVSSCDDCSFIEVEFV